jgi:hypothetical protein
MRGVLMEQHARTVRGTGQLKALILIQGQAAKVSGK